jgi:hypothetical protein
MWLAITLDLFPFVMRNVVFFQNHNPYNSTSSNNPSLNIIHLIWNISYIISIIIFMFFFFQSHDVVQVVMNVFLVWIFVQMQFCFDVGTPRKVYLNFVFAQKKGLWIGFTRFKVHTYRSHQITTNYQKIKLLCIIMSTVTPIIVHISHKIT